MCSECQGQGERIDPKLRCKKCNGRKVNRERKILEVQIDKGMEDGQKITFSGEGDQVCIITKNGLGILLLVTRQRLCCASLVFLPLSNFF